MAQPLNAVEFPGAASFAFFFSATGSGFDPSEFTLTVYFLDDLAKRARSDAASLALTRSKARSSESTRFHFDEFI